MAEARASRDARRPGRARPVAVPADRVLNFSGYDANRARSGSPPTARGGSGGGGRARAGPARHRTREHFVTANCRFAVNPDRAGALAGALVDSDAPLDWDAVDVVFVERDASEDAAHDCPICLQTLSCAKITPCGHVFDHVCLLQHVAFSRVEGGGGGGGAAAGPPPPGTAVKCPLCAHVFPLGSLRNVAFREVCAAQVGAVCDMSLVCTQGHCTVALPYAPNAAHGIPAHVGSFEQMYTRFVFASRSFLLDMLAAMSSDLRNTLAEDRSLKPFVDQASRDVKVTRQAIRRRTSRESRPLPLGGPPGGAVVSPKETRFSPSSLESETSPMQLMGRSSLDRRRGSPDQHSAGKLRLFYQAHDAQNIYLHPVNHRCLLFEYNNDLTRAEAEVSGRILEIERFTMDEVLRKRYRFLKHLPEGCEFVLVELDLSHVMSPKTVAHFNSELNARKAARVRKEKESEIESRRVSKMQTESLQDYFRNGNPRHENTFSNVTVDRNEANFPALSGFVEAGASSTVDSVHPRAIPGGGARPVVAHDAGSSPGSAWGGAEISSYSSVASNMGLFPALGSSTGAVASTPPSPARGAWASVPPAANNGGNNGPAQGRESRRHRRSNGRQTFTVFSNAGSNYRP